MKYRNIILYKNHLQSQENRRKMPQKIEKIVFANQVGVWYHGSASVSIL